MQFTHHSGTIDVPITQLTIAGWTGRDNAAVAHHIAELAAIGVPPPSQTPLFYRTSNILLVQASVVQVVGNGSSGEAEPMLIQHDGTLWLGLGSDHTDRALEATSVAASKQACPKVCAGQLWRFDDVADTLDDVRLQSWIGTGADEVLYQDGTLEAILPLADLLQQHPLSDGHAMLCGTLPAMGGVRPSTHFRASLSDPQHGQTISLAYRTDVLPEVS